VLTCPRSAEESRVKKTSREQIKLKHYVIFRLARTGLEQLLFGLKKVSGAFFSNLLLLAS
jgi:hypothetical protein